MIDYIPKEFNIPVVINVTSAWEPLAGVIQDIINRFNINQYVALEFGVERGFSTSVLSNYFTRVVGIDTFDWIIPDGVDRTFHEVAKLLSGYKNIELIQSPFEDFIKNDLDHYDLIHIDIGYDTHAYEPTYQCGEWAVKHSDCVLFHDTLSFSGVNQACEELSEKYGFDYYNYEEEIGPAAIVCGLGILIKKI